ncbi:unnamed protein product, partial [Polarella glacialis]
SVETVFGLIEDIAASLYFCKQVVVLCAVYVDRLLEQTHTTLTAGNWRSVVIVALLIASKVWEDVHPWNADFEECLQEIAGIRYKTGALYKLESLFLEKLGWKVFVDGEVYAAYFFALLEGRPACASTSYHPKNYRDLWTRRHSHDNFTIDTIAEEEVYDGIDCDLERGSSEYSRQGGDHEYSDYSSRSRSRSIGGGVGGERSPSPSPSPLPWSREEL